MFLTMYNNKGDKWEAEVLALAGALDEWRILCRERYGWQDKLNKKQFEAHSDIITRCAGN